MSKLYKTAAGKQIDIENLISKNENVIAVGNKKVNARGDQLGPGGKVVKTRDQIMREYYALNTPVATEIPSQAAPVQTTQPVQRPAPVIPPAPVPRPAPVIQEPVVINPDSGMDEIDNIPEQVVEAVIPAQEPAVVAPPAPPVLTPFVPGQLVDQPNEQAAEHGDVIRGSLANAIAKEVTVTQTPKLPPKKANGIQRF